VGEEMSHYLLEESVTGKPTALTTFYYPPKILTDAQTTLDIRSGWRTRSSPQVYSNPNPDPTLDVRVLHR
jgi:hypothetical protein